MFEELWFEHILRTVLHLHSKDGWPRSTNSGNIWWLKPPQQLSRHDIWNYSKDIHLKAVWTWKIFWGWPPFKHSIPMPKESKRELKNEGPSVGMGQILKEPGVYGAQYLPAYTRYWDFYPHWWVSKTIAAKVRQCVWNGKPHLVWWWYQLAIAYVLYMKLREREGKIRVYELFPRHP